MPPATLASAAPEPCVLLFALCCGSGVRGQSGCAQGSPGHSALPTEEELRKLREETNSETLRQELERERQRRVELEQKVQEVLRAR